MGKPKLIRETSRKSLLLQYLDIFCEELLSVLTRSDSKKHNEKCTEKMFKDVVLERALKQRVLSIVKSASKARKNNAPHRHVLFFGPPGTGM
jgi:ATPase family AAA domain-containing protein 3A/B